MTIRKQITMLVLLAALMAALGAAACGSSPAAAPTPMPSTPTPLVVDAVPTPTVEVSASEGMLAPEFTLASDSGETVSLAGLLGGREAVVIVFYRGFF